MSDRIVSTLKQVAEHYGIRYDTVRKDWRRQGMPGERGRWDLDAIDEWRSLRHSQKDRTGTLTPDGAAITEAERQRTGTRDAVSAAKERAAVADAARKEAEAKLKEIAARRAENIGLVEIVEVEEFIGQWLSEARNIISAVPEKLSRFGQDVADAAQQELELAMHAVYKKSLRLVDLRGDE